MDFWNDAFKEKKIPEDNAEQKKQEHGVVLGMVTSLIPVEKIIGGIIGKIAAEMSVDIAAVGKNFNRFVKTIPANSKEVLL